MRNQLNGTEGGVLRLAIFDDEKAVQPRHINVPSWDGVIKLMERRYYRLHKSGPMVGGYALSGSRSNKNVLYRTLVQLDIDSEVAKDSATGQLLAVTRRAPELTEITPAIKDYAWVATSSHSHAPALGVIKYRITMLPDRAILPEEHEAVLEALDDRLGGCLDRAAWPLSQAFYLPSCPAERASEAFFHRNHGVALPVDEFAAIGRQIIATRQQQKTQRAIVNHNSNVQLIETVPNLEIVKAMLAAIPADIGRRDWCQAIWGVASLGWSQGEQLVRNWSETRPKKWDAQDAQDFNGVWSSFDPTRPDATTIHALQRLAQAKGYTGPLLTAGGAPFANCGPDVSNGRLFAQIYRDKLIHIHETNEWLKFDPRSGWLAAAPLEQDQAAKEVHNRLRADAAHQLALGTEGDKLRKLIRHVEYTGRAPSIRAMIEMARSEPGMTKRLSEFDANPTLLGVVNGVLDLNSGKLLPVSPDVLVSKRCRVAFDAGATCPRFDQFMVEIQPDNEMRLFLQRWVGYCLTGLATEQKFAFLHGSGANGKSVFVELVAWLLGDYSKKIQTEMLMQHQRSPQSPSPDIVGLKGVRFAYANETEEGRRLADARVKDLTGGDTLIGRVPYGKAEILFEPSHKLVLVGNHKPEIADMSQGMWRRVILVGFDQTIPEDRRDPHLLDALKAEGAAILNWALEGHRQWRKTGLHVPASVMRATAAYRDEQDIIGEWITERCVTGSGSSARKSDLYVDYSTWAKANGHMPLAQGRLTRRLNDRGYKLLADKRTVSGLALIHSYAFLSGP